MQMKTFTMLAARFAIATFDESDWIAFGLTTGELDRVQEDPRLLRALRFGDPDYKGVASSVVDDIVHALHNPWTFDPDEAAKSFEGLKDWAEHNDPKKYEELWPVEDTESGDSNPAVEDDSPEVLSKPLPTVGQVLAEMASSPPAPEVVAAVPPSEPTNDSEALKIFLVHGHDEAFRNTVRLFVQDITGILPTVLNFEASGGRTLIEKFEEYSHNADVAIVLLTPDDFGRAASEPTEQKRARQNVILELGYFLGALGRSRVISINKGVEQPSDMAGIVYIPVDDEWREKLRKELRAANIPIKG